MRTYKNIKCNRCSEEINIVYFMNGHDCNKNDNVWIGFCEACYDFFEDLLKYNICDGECKFLRVSDYDNDIIYCCAGVSNLEDVENIEDIKDYDYASPSVETKEELDSLEIADDVLYDSGLRLKGEKCIYK